MRVACYCGSVFEDGGDIVQCPSCGTVVVAVSPVPADERKEMEASLAELLAAQEPDAAEA